MRLANPKPHHIISATKADTCKLDSSGGGDHKMVIMVKHSPLL